MRILICEDEIDLADGLCAILKGNKYSVDVVYDGEEALTYLGAENYDAVILDIMMPKVDGITAVSYTHLDVYKRQQQCVLFLKLKIQREQLVDYSWIKKK